VVADKLAFFDDSGGLDACPEDTQTTTLRAYAAQRVYELVESGLITRRQVNAMAHSQ